MLSWVFYTTKRQHSNLQSEVKSANFYTKWVTLAVTARWFIAWFVRLPLATWWPPALRLEIDCSRWASRISGECRHANLQVGVGEMSICRIFKQLLLKKGLCQVGSEDVDGCPQSNPENNVHRNFGTVLDWWGWLSCKSSDVRRNLAEPFWNGDEEASNGMTRCKLTNEEEIQNWVFSRKCYGSSCLRTPCHMDPPLFLTRMWQP